MAVEKRLRDLLVAVCIVVEHPCRHPDGCIRQRVAYRLRVFGHLDEVAPPKEGCERIECHGFLLLGPVGDNGDRNPLEESSRNEPAEQCRPHREREGAEEVEVNAEQPVRSQASHRVSDVGADIAALGDVPVVAEPVHQLSPGSPHAAWVPAEHRRLAGEAEAGQGREHKVERVLGVSAVCGRVGERFDDVYLLNDSRIALSKSLVCIVAPYTTLYSPSDLYVPATNRLRFSKARSPSV